MKSLIAQRSIIEENYNRVYRNPQAVQELDQKFKQVNTLTQGKHRLEMAIVKAGEDLNKAHAVSENRIHELEIVSQKLPELQEEMKQVTGQLRVLDESETKLQEKRESSKLLRARVHFLQAEKIRLTQEIDQIEDKLKMLSHQTGVTCPLCETELGADGQKRIETKYLAEKAAKNEALKANQVELAQKEAEVRTLEIEILQDEAKLKARQRDRPEQIR